MDWPIQEFPITSLYLDQQNIRTPISKEDQNALIRDMFTNEEAFEIVTSFVQNGTFPDEFPIGIQENSKNIIIEGNRRLAALKALSEPDIVPSWAKKIRMLNNPNINKIRIVLAPSREAATKHIANKHTINFRRPWKPLRQAYFYKSQIENGKSIDEIIQEYPAHDVPRFIKMLEMHHLAKSIDLHDSLKQKIHDDRNFPITNLERFYNDNHVAKFLGIQFDSSGRIRGSIDKNEFIKGFKKIIEDVTTGGIDSRKFNKMAQRKIYIKNLPSQYRPDLSKKGSFGSSDFKEVSAPQSEGKHDRSKKIPKGLFFQADIPFKLSSTSLRMMFNELRDIDVKQFPNASHDLLRSFLECVLVYYLEEITDEYKLVKKSGKYNPKLSEILTFVSSEHCISVKNPNIKQIVNQIKSDWSDSYSLARMNMINHVPDWTSVEKDVRSAWGKIERLMKYLLNPL